MPIGSSTAIGADSSSVGGADDSDERSESESDDMLDFGWCCASGGLDLGLGKGRMVAGEKS